jgi:hypothetical protein
LAELIDSTGKPLIGSKKIDGPVIRLLRCLVCETWEELPDYEGPSDKDYLLEIAIEKHVFPSGDPHVGKLFKVPIKTWANTEQRKAVLDNLGAGSRGLDDLDPEKSFYDTKMTFAEDAMTCWKAHNKVKENCEDYESPKKRLLPNTAKERGELGLPKPEHLDGPKIYTCHFCPVHTSVITRRRELAGLYDN